MIKKEDFNKITKENLDFCKKVIERGWCDNLCSTDCPLYGRDCYEYTEIKNGMCMSEFCDEFLKLFKSEVV